MFRIYCAESDDDLRDARALLDEYVESLGFDLDFQNVEKELADFPGEYAPPGGCILIVRDLDGDPVGCVALRELEPGVCEMKRMYVSPGVRGRGLGRALAMGLIDNARRLGYRRMRLDTLASMEAANELYRSLGFRSIEPYRHNPFADAVYMELTIPKRKGGGR